jgi:hypothetical protein
MTTMLTAEQNAQAMVANPRWARRLGWDRYLDAISVLLGVSGSAAGHPAFAQAVADWQEQGALAVDGVVGPKSWARLKIALAPPSSLTGVTPLDAPPVPSGFAEVIAAFGDPRPFISPDGSITPDSEARWQRQTLAKGVLPFAIPLNRANPGGPMKTTFYAHRTLVGVFEGVFQEILRLGLQAYVLSWGGIYNFRPIRGTATQLSLHCFGAALDLNAETNGLGTSGDMNPGVVEVFEHFGFFWGGNFRGRPDPMHFQYARGY